MHDTLLSQAALPAPVRILGLLMRPYSLGHELRLIRESNPLVVGGDPKREDLAEAVLICSQTFRESCAMSSDWLLPLKMWAWRRRARKLPTEPHMQAFVEYRQSGSLEFPESNTPSNRTGQPRYIGAPFLLRLHQFLCTKLNQSQEQAWDYPYGLGKMQFAAHLEEEGHFDIYNAHDAEHDRLAREFDEREAAELKGK